MHKRPLEDRCHDAVEAADGEEEGGGGDDEGILLGPNGLYLLSTQQLAPAARAMSQIALMSQI